MNANLTRLWRLGESFLDAERDDLENKQTGKTTYEKKKQQKKTKFSAQRKSDFTHHLKGAIHTITCTDDKKNNNFETHFAFSCFTLQSLCFFCAMC